VSTLRRSCTGNPDAPDFAYCGKLAVYVAAKASLERFSCSEHAGDWQLTPVYVWRAELDRVLEEQRVRREADEATARLRTLAAEDDGGDVWYVESGRTSVQGANAWAPVRLRRATVSDVYGPFIVLPAGAEPEPSK
jgi:hypothetical protein